MALIVLGVAGCTLAQDSPRKPDTQTISKTASTTKPKLVDAVRVSTQEAVASAAKQESAKGVPEKNPKDSSTDAVLEFHTAAPAGTEDNSQVVASDSKKSPLKKIHGEAYGADGSGGNQEGAKAGTSSKSGKTSIYVETDRSHTTPPR